MSISSLLLITSILSLWQIPDSQRRSSISITSGKGTGRGWGGSRKREMDEVKRVYKERRAKKMGEHREWRGGGLKCA